jgi:hypothetical protein
VARMLTKFNGQALLIRRNLVSGFYEVRITTSVDDWMSLPINSAADAASVQAWCLGAFDNCRVKVVASVESAEESSNA